jgi:cysteinyl-tRNA synthetase
MSSKYLGLPFDIHGGGMDLRFPHHENEIAQAEASTDKTFAKYWIHVGLLTVNGEKMSKSIGNIINVKDLLSSWNSEVIRFFFAQSHYRSPPDFSENALKKSQKGLSKIHRLKEKLEFLSALSDKKIVDNDLTNEEKNYLKIIQEFENSFILNMDDDFNTPGVTAVIFEFISNSNKFINKNPNPNKSLCKYALCTLLKIGNVLTLFQDEIISDNKNIVKKLQKILSELNEKTDSNDLNILINKILLIRNNARKEKKWNLADEIRYKLDQIGIEIQDTKDGSIWRKKIRSL